MKWKLAVVAFIALAVILAVPSASADNPAKAPVVTSFTVPASQLPVLNPIVPSAAREHFGPCWLTEAAAYAYALAGDYKMAALVMEMASMDGC